MKVWVAAICILRTFFGFSQEAKKIVETFTAYQQAVIHGEGIRAFELVNQNTVHFYNEVWNASKMADSATVSKFPFEEKLWILTTRHLVPRTRASQLTTQSVFEYLIKNGWIHKEDLGALQLGEISIEGKYAIAPMKQNSIELPYFFQFEKENGIWKVNLIAMLETAGRSVEAMIEISELSEETVIIESIEQLSGKKTNKAIWLPFKS